MFHYSKNVLAKFDENRLNLYTLQIAQSVCIPPKIKCEILAHKGSQRTRAMPGDYLAS